MLDTSIIPKWSRVDGYLFRREDLLRSRRRWWWFGGRLQAWRLFRQRMIAFQREVETGYVDPQYAWLECRMFLQMGERSALNMAIAVTERQRQVNALITGVGMRLSVDGLARIAKAGQDSLRLPA